MTGIKREEKPVDALRLWVISLISVTILCTLIEKLAPEGNLNKYVKLASGLVVTLVIAGPVIKFASGGFDIRDVTWKDYVSLSEGEMKQRVARLTKENSREFLEVYRETLASDIKTRYAGDPGFSVVEADAVLQEDYQSNDFGAIRELYIKIGPPENNPDAIFGPEAEKKLSDELSGALGVDRNRIVIDSSNFRGR